MIRKLDLINFRRFDNLTLNITNNLVIIVGNNALGKTSILESIYAISTTKSHKADDYKEMIQLTKPYAHIILKSDKQYEFIISNLGKKVLINQLEYKKISDFAGDLKTVLFSPDDLFLILGSKALRRNFLDLEISLLQKKYLSSTNTYKKLLKQRNDLLKVFNKEQELILKVLTDQLVEEAKYIIEVRMSFIEQLNDKLKSIIKLLNFKELINIKYNPSCTLDKIEEIFKEKQQYDILTKMTNYGPHRDDFCVIFNEKNANIYASQGQIRSFVICIKIALLEIIKQKSKKDVILLLDDVFSELDDFRQMNLVSYLLRQYQTFITTTNLHSVPNELIKLSQIIKVKE